MNLKPYYQDDYCTIYHGDCREILPNLPKVDLVVTDPPYGINLNTAWLTTLNVKRGKPANKSDNTLYGDDQVIDISILFKYQKRMIWGFPYLIDKEATGWIVWDKQPGVARRGIVTPVEMASTTCRKGFDVYRCMWGGYMRPRGEQRFEHPTQKPLKIFSIPISEWSQQGWRKFTLYEVLALAICGELRRQFSLPLEQLRDLYRWLKEQVPFIHAFNCAEGGFPVYLVGMNPLLILTEPLLIRFISDRRITDPIIICPLNGIFNEVLVKVKNESIGGKNALRYRK